jgi:hypothetical protein
MKMKILAGLRGNWVYHVPQGSLGFVSGRFARGGLPLKDSCKWILIATLK